MNFETDIFFSTFGFYHLQTIVPSLKAMLLYATVFSSTAGTGNGLWRLSYPVDIITRIFFQMPTDAWYLYKRSSADNGTVQSLQSVKASSECTSDVQELQCVAVYCSEDEKYLLTEYTKADCENTTKRW